MCYLFVNFETPEITNLTESAERLFDQFLSGVPGIMKIAVIALFKLGRQSNSMNPMNPAYNHCLKTMVICGIHRIHRIRLKMYLLK
jgi:hypothetical protein